MKKIIDNIYFNNKNSIELEYKYIYNLYKEDEATQPENAISSESPEADSFIRLQVDLKNDYNNYDINSSSGIINRDKIIEISSYDNLPSILNDLFVLPETVNSTRSYITLDNNFEDLTAYYNVYKSKEDINQINYSTKISVKDTFLNKINVANKKSPFYSKYSNNITKTYDDIYEENLEVVDFNTTLDSGNFLGKYIPYNHKTNIRMDSDRYKNNAEDFFRFIGFYILKYRKDELDKDEPYIKVASRFVLNTISNTSNENIQVISDNHIKYGNTYKYLIFPVHTLTIQSYKSMFLQDQIFLCDYPLITEDIEAVKTARPGPPNGVTAKLNKTTNKIEITWEKPLDKENDTKGFQVFKRSNLDEPFVLIKEYRGHLLTDSFNKNQVVQPSSLEITPGVVKTRHVDSTFDSSKVNIYSVCTIDAHGLVSNYSSQIGVVYDAILDKIFIDEISLQGAPIEYPNMLIPRKTKYFNNEESIITNIPLCTNKSKFSFYFTPDCKAVKGQMLATGDSQSNLIEDNINYSLSIFRINGQKSITLENKEPQIKIRNFT